MPIYAYRCSSCGYEKDALQKLSDAPLTLCPECGQETFSKQVTAAGFQLKGSGWYVTDFRDGNKGGKPAAKPADGASAATADAAPASAAKEGTNGSAAGNTSTASSAATPAASTPAVSAPTASSASDSSKSATGGSKA
ncbi:FmdB family zinc ribbon protein [Burkholderia sp. L27(2015)]|uniref:FmdB family zinc ribbon protein n=1 Tax=Burkholderia sp. L27(2015) TaxID=1641858 RepID=UPI00131D0EEE|nr:FmdB family zinc ribbon protein [Burkholderia sp. L27(2015)]